MAATVRPVMLRVKLVALVVAVPGRKLVEAEPVEKVQMVVMVLPIPEVNYSEVVVEARAVRAAPQHHRGAEVRREETVVPAVLPASVEVLSLMLVVAVAVVEQAEERVVPVVEGTVELNREPAGPKTEGTARPTAEAGVVVEALSW